MLLWSIIAVELTDFSTAQGHVYFSQQVTKPNTTGLASEKEIKRLFVVSFEVKN